MLTEPCSLLGLITPSQQASRHFFDCVRWLRRRMNGWAGEDAGARGRVQGCIGEDKYGPERTRLVGQHAGTGVINEFAWERTRVAGG